MSAKPAESLEELKSQIMSGLKEAMAGEITEIAKDKIQKSAQENVVGKFSRITGGISDKSNITAKVSEEGGTIVLEVQDEAKPQPSIFGTEIIDSSPTLFAEWIEDGDWLDVMKYKQTGVKEKRPARPFMEPAEKGIEADRSKIEAIIKTHLEG